MTPKATILRVCTEMEHWLQSAHDHGLDGCEVTGILVSYAVRIEGQTQNYSPQARQELQDALCHTIQNYRKTRRKHASDN